VRPLHREYVDAIRSDGAALASAASRAGVDTPVPSCPLWSVADLLGHIGRIHRWVAQLVIDRALERGAHWSEEEPPPPGELVDWFAAGVPLLADALADAGPDVPMWSWVPDATTGFWARRQAHETAVHRVDAQLAANEVAANEVAANEVAANEVAANEVAANEVAPVDHALAVDGIDEFFDLIPFVPWTDRVRGTGETVHLHCTDGDGEWLVRLGTDGAVITREHAKGDAAVRGTASDLLLFLYGRVAAGELDVFGDAAVLTRWRELVSW
jgi:uncharacterized protein (TIGR03083 family)